MTIDFIVENLGKTFANKGKFIINRPNDEIKELATDSRNHFVAESALFFALSTPGGRDGHDFMQNLHDIGVRNFVCQKIPGDFKGIKDSNILIVPDSFVALSSVGALPRRNAKEVVAISGSRGKTTLKEMLFQFLEPGAKISRSPRSYNSKIGVPLSLWQISPDSDYAIIEAGISKKGEMEPLAKIIRPDSVILTNIGDPHSNGFFSMEEKAVEKAILAIQDNVKTIIFSLDDPFISNSLSSLKPAAKTLTWSLSNPKADILIQTLSNGFRFIYKNIRGEIEADLSQPYDLENYANALAFLLKEKIPIEEIKSRFAHLHRIKTRLNVSEGLNGCSLVVDSYTSDLSSLIPAIDFMKRRKMPWQSSSLIISDLHHEGNSIEETYNEIARIVRQTKINRFIGIGPSFSSFAALFPKDSLFFNSVEEFLKEFSPSSFNNEIILLKASPEFHFKAILQQLEARHHETVLEVNLDALLRNYNYFRSHVPSSTGIIAMVKASGYGAGSFEIAKTLQDAGASYLAVAALDEGIDLRRNGIIMPIMVMNPRAANYQALFNNRLEPVVYSPDMLLTFIREARRYDFQDYPIHLKLDTGMHRMGFLEEEIPGLCEDLRMSSKLKVASIFSHLATADCLDMDEFTLKQLQRFEKMSSEIIKTLGYPVKRHILNSAGILRFPDHHYDLVRLGIGLYGANTLPPSIEKPLAIVSSLRSVIICIREIEGNEAVGYGRKGKIKGKTRIATLPVGYADGINRKFGNGAIKVFINGSFAPTIGNICMDAMMIDVSGIDCREGDSVEIFGENASLQRLADSLDTIPYEVLTSVSPRVKRIYYRE
ncbi:MAG: bifunctional UDP-N-acetylmuramoyl-tripeptide:D-alanyl-D-alanine ligase/alanine racemase [Muribaculaceae bacterium]|nr:bifunctional UDP-N-acetylmuramoyl-tripeptide:D-alanyl-D-alanine ligase/alanine racemase [Muribaculaceae bacterium]